MSTSAQRVFHAAAIGALITYSDGQPRPPARFKRKLEAWRRFNGVGRLDAKRPGVSRRAHHVPARFELHVGDFGSHGVIVMTVHKVFDVRSPLHFEVVDSASGQFVCFITDGIHLEVEQVVSSAEDATAWLDRPRAEPAFVAEVQPDRTLRRLPPTLALVSA